MRELAKRLGFSAASVLKAHAPVLYERLKLSGRRMNRCAAASCGELGSGVGGESPAILKSVYARLGVTESIVNSAGSGGDSREAIGLRHQQYRLGAGPGAQERRSGGDPGDLSAQLDAAGICPCVRA